VYFCQRASVNLNCFAAESHLFQFGLALDVALVAALLELVERGLGDVDEAGLDQLGHLAEQERQREGADVRAVDISVRHEDDLVVAGVLDVELLADTRSERGDQRLNLVVLQHLVDPRLLDVEDLAS